MLKRVLIKVKGSFKFDIMPLFRSSEFG